MPQGRWLTLWVRNFSPRVSEEEESCSHFPASHVFFPINTLPRKARNEPPENPLPTDNLFISPLCSVIQLLMHHPDFYCYGNGYIWGQNPMCIPLFLFFLLIWEIVGLVQPETVKACCWLTCWLMCKCLFFFFFFKLYTVNSRSLWSRAVVCRAERQLHLKAVINKVIPVDLGSGTRRLRCEHFDCGELEMCPSLRVPHSLIWREQERQRETLQGRGGQKNSPCCRSQRPLMLHQHRPKSGRPADSQL